MRISSIAASAFALASFLAGDAVAQTVVSGNITTDTSWSGTIVLNGAIFVNNNATLTIQPGTIVRGQPRTAAVLAGSTVGTPGALIVTQTGTIIAEGTAAQPIIMTTAAVDNNDDGVPDDDDMNGFNDAWQPGDAFLDDTPTTAPLSPLNPLGQANVALWGGLVVLGNAPTNLGDACGTSAGEGTCTVEGLTVPGFPEADALYGGTDAADSSGALSYVSVRHAGDEIGDGNELNGVTLAGVGSGTEINFIEVYCNFDDGIEWFGGTVNADHLQVVFAGDDQFDADQGFTGTTQFLVGILPFFNEGDGTNFGSSSGDKGCECDGDDFDEGIPNVRYVGGTPGNAPSPLSNADFYNFTIAGSLQSQTFNGHTNNNDGWEMRNGFAGLVANGIIYNTANSPTTGRQGIDLAGGGAINFTVGENATNGLLAVATVTCDDVRGIPSAPSDEATALANGGGNIGCDGINDPGFGLLQEDTSFDPTGSGGKLDSSLTSFDLRPSSANATMTGGLNPMAPAPDPTATYRGAYDSVSAKWTDGWTVMSMSGMTPVPEPGLVPGLMAGVLGMIAKGRRR
ncbi:MAG: hypothetical protein JRF61_04085 [Deltaproteobacteria bacterium]|jgi:hypothetical protein|nr:hypothetical protein [Deltaproteobacteria bacterium]